MSAEPAFVRETLDWCNLMRAERGQEPLERLPLGVQYDETSCPCGRATGLMVGDWSYWVGGVYDPEEAKDTPQAVQDFVKAFDGGALPQFIDGGQA